MIDAERPPAAKRVTALITIGLRATTRAAQYRELKKFTVDVRKLAKKYRGRVGPVKTVTLRRRVLYP